MPLTHENIRLFWTLFVSSYKESSHEESKICPFPNICLSYLNKVNKVQIHPANPTNLDILKFFTKFLQTKDLQKFKICPSLTRSLKCQKKNYPKILDIIEFIR